MPPEAEMLKLLREEQISRSPAMTYIPPTGRVAGLASLARRVVAAAAATFPPTLDDPRPFGIDLSVYNGRVDYEALGAFDRPGVEYAFVRLGQGTSYLDPNFVDHWTGIRHYTNIPRMAYYPIYPGYAVQPQVDNVARGFEQVQGDMGEGPLWNDWELVQNTGKAAQSARCLQFVEGLREALAWRVGIYSGNWFLSAYAEPQPWWAETDWWLAHYLKASTGREHPGPPLRPTIIPAGRVVFHQTTSSISGPLLGVESQRLDGNRYMLAKPLSEYLSGEAPPPPPPPGSHEHPDLEARLDGVARDLADVIEWARTIRSYDG